MTVSVKAGRRTSVAAGSLLGLSGSIISVLGGFAIVVVATRWLGAAGSGGLFVAVAAFTVASNVCKIGTDTALVRFVAQSLARDNGRQVRGLVGPAVAAATVASMVVGAVLVGLAGPIAGLLYASPGAQPGPALIRLVGVLLPCATVTLVLLAAVRGFGRVTAFVVVEQIFKPVVRPILIVVVCLCRPDVRSALLAWLLPVVPGLLIAIVAVRRHLRALPSQASAPQVSLHRGADDSSALASPGAMTCCGREFWGFAAPRALGGAMEILTPWVGVLMLSALASSRDAGIFAAAARVVTTGTMLSVALRLALGPHLSAAFAADDQRRLGDLLRHSTTWAVLPSFPFFITIAVFPETVMSLFGDGFADGAAVLAVVAVANLVNVGVGNVQSVTLMAGRSSWNLVNTGLALLVQVVAGLALIPSFGLVGAGVAVALSVLVNNLLSVRQVRHGLGIEVWSRGVLSTVALTLGASVPLELLIRVLIGQSVSALVVAVALVVVVMAAGIVWGRGRLDLEHAWQTLSRDFSAAEPGVQEVAQ